MRKVYKPPVLARRSFIGAMATLAAAPVIQARPAPTLADLVPGKGPLRLLNDRPINAETPAHLLNDEVTPTANLFVRNNGQPPKAVEPEQWQLRIGGESCLRPATFSIDELKTRFKQVTFALQLECGGNGRAEFRPRASGNQWTTGAVGCPEWTGVRLRDVLDFCGIANDAVYVGYRSADTHLSGDSTKDVISRGVPISKALEAETLIAFRLNGADMTPLHGAPLRLVAGGWPGSVSGKWLSELIVRNRVHDGAKMGGNSYRVPAQPVAPGTSVPEADMRIIESMPVKSLITSPRSGRSHPLETSLVISGHAWAGDVAVAQVALSIDYGATWQPATLAKPRNRLAWQRFETSVRFPNAGYFEVWARATDANGLSQPMLVPGWNPKGYLNNAAHRIAVHVA